MSWPLKVNIKDIPSVGISHGAGRKKVFISYEDTDSALTPFAWSRLTNENHCPIHGHPTMDEYFFVH